MKIFIYVTMTTVLITVAGCVLTPQSKADGQPVPHEISETDVGHNITRYENDEVLCYEDWNRSNGDIGFQCKFKSGK